MTWRDEVLLDTHFFGPPGTGYSEAQKKMIKLAVGAVGGAFTTLNFIYYLKLELERHAPEVAEKLGLSHSRDDVKDANKESSHA